MKKERYLVPQDYMADPAVHVFNGRVYIYPSHDWDSGAGENDNGDHFEMKDYHVFSTDDIMEGEVIDHGKVLDVADIPWAGRQLWDCDVAEKDGQTGRSVHSAARSHPRQLLYRPGCVP